MRTLPVLSALVLMLCLPSPLHSQAKVEKVAQKALPTEFRKVVGIVGKETAAQWDGLLTQVNAPNFREKAFPAQRLTFAVLAQGKGRDQLLKDAEYSFSVDYLGGTKEFKNLHPVQIRQIKAEGADFVQFAMKEIKVDSKEVDSALSIEVDSALSMVSVALFDLEWIVPGDAKDGAATVRGSIQPKSGKPITLDPSTLQVRSFGTAIKEGAFKDKDQVGEWMMTYYKHPEPSRVLNAFRVSGNDQTAFTPNVMGFFVEVLKSSPEAARDLLGRLNGEEKVTRMYALHLLREAGYEVGILIQTLPEEEQTVLSQLPSKIPPLPDPFELSVDPADFQKLPMRFDMLWGKFLATGQMKPVRAIAGALAWRDDYKAYVTVRDEYQKTGKRAEGSRPDVVRGVAYMAAGWSLGSFVRNHGIVADFVNAWKLDPATPPVIKEELGTLITNPAFKRN